MAFGVDPVRCCAQFLFERGADGGCGGADEGFILKVVSCPVRERFKGVENFLTDAAGFIGGVKARESKYVSLISR